MLHCSSCRYWSLLSYEDLCDLGRGFSLFELEFSLSMTLGQQLLPQLCGCWGAADSLAGQGWKGRWQGQLMINDKTGILGLLIEEKLSLGRSWGLAASTLD